MTCTACFTRWQLVLDGEIEFLSVTADITNFTNEKGRHLQRAQGKGLRFRIDRKSRQIRF